MRRCFRKKSKWLVETLGQSHDELHRAVVRSPEDAVMADVGLVGRRADLNEPLDNTLPRILIAEVDPLGTVVWRQPRGAQAATTQVVDHL